MTGPLRRGWGGGWGVKGRPLREKKLFNFFLPFKNKSYYTLDNFSKYGYQVKVCR